MTFVTFSRWEYDHVLSFAASEDEEKQSHDDSDVRLSSRTLQPDEIAPHQYSARVEMTIDHILFFSFSYQSHAYG